MFDWKSLLKYILEGIAIALATFLIPSSKLDYIDIILIALTGAAMFAVLDQFSPMVAVGARQGSGFAIGYHQVGMGDPIEESNTNTNVASQDGTPEIAGQEFTCDEQNGQCGSVSNEVEGFGGFQTNQ